MKKRYIDPEILKKSLKHFGLEDAIYRDEIEMYIDDTPTADVVEVKHGYWQEISNGDDGWIDLKCPICKKVQSLYVGEERPNYCSNCGAKLDSKLKKEVRNNA